MRWIIVNALRTAWSAWLGLSSVACEARPTLEPAPAPRASLAPSHGASRPAPSLPAAASAPLPPPRAASSETAAIARQLRASRLTVPPQREHRPRLAFGRGVLGQLTHDELRVFDLASFERIASHPLSGPRALVALADGALLAVGGDRALRFEPGNRRFEPVVRPALLWGDIYADAQLRDRIWLFDGGGAPALGPPQLHAFRLVAGAARVQLPEQSIELAAPRGGVFGASREGVWLYLTPGRAERLSPGGLRLPGFALAETELPAWVLPARRLDQGLWLDEAGSLSRRLVVPPGRRLGAPAELAGRPYAVAVGDEGKLVAVTAVTAPGPGFELLLLDAELRLVARRELPSEEPPDGDDWVQAVTANQQVAVSSTKPLVAVGGPGRLRVLDGRGEEIFSIPSR